MAEDEIAESWEELEDSGELDKRLQRFENQGSTEERRKNASQSAVLEETDRSAYQPQVRILKRQTQSNSASDSHSQARNVSTKPTKSLAEREAAYAEARLRILGAAKDNEDDANCENDTAATERPLRLTQKLEGVKLAENVIRQPKGPNGSKGFNTCSADKPR